jgi:hypothetical protein
MIAADRRVAWIAPLLVGACAAIAAEVAIGVLLYAGPGLVRSLTTVLAVEGAALAAGLWRGPLSAADLDGLRRSWVFCLAAFAAAAAFGTTWSIVEEFGSGPLGQGLGLAVLAALPLYSCGLVLAGMGAVASRTGGAGERVQSCSGSDPARSALVAGAGPLAALGAAIGFVITGAFLPRAPIPASLLVVCLLMLSGAGLVFSAGVSGGTVVRLRVLRASPLGDVRVEDHASERAEGGVVRFLLEAGHERRRLPLDGGPGVPWDVALVRGALVAAIGSETSAGGASAPPTGSATFAPEALPAVPARVLVVGGGASPLVADPPAEDLVHAVVDVLERNEVVVELAAEHLDGGARPERVQVGNLEDLIAGVAGAYEVVVVDMGGLAPLGGVSGLSRAARAKLFGSVAPGGAIAFGPVAPDPTSLGVPEGWSAVRLRRADAEVLLLAPRDAPAQWSGAFPGFEPVDGRTSGS